MFKLWYLTKMLAVSWSRNHWKQP